MYGFGADSAKRQQEIEQRVAALAQTEKVAEFSRALAARPHVAGTEPQARTRDYVVEQMREWGLTTSVAEYEVYLPHPTAVVLDRLTPAPKRFTLQERPLPEASGSADPQQWPAWLGYAAAGDVEGEIVYVNYAREEDLDQLQELGIKLEGKIALARYGELFRGIKVLNVQRRGAIGCILFCDPAEDGYFRGDVYPDGPMRPASGLQRGSLNTGAGDPTAPGRVSVAGVERISPAEATALPQIPSVPVAYAAAEELLRDLHGAEVPQAWQGGLPFRYHVGPGPLRVRLKVEHDGGYRKIWNTLARIEGSSHPDEWILVGGHRDAWCCGAVDNVSGVVSVMEAARICAELARAGQRPKRTLIFATWDAEEWGLIGSTEWVEQEREALREKAVAYINQDVVAAGPDFGTAGSPSLTTLVRDVAGIIPSPDKAERTLADVWAERQDGKANLGRPGGGSDHEGFFLHLGVPFVGFGFGGRCGTYHSAYDTTEWMERFGDPEYRRHRAAAALTASLVLRLANADALPFDYVPYAELVEEAVAESAGRAAKDASLKDISFASLADAAQAFHEAATVLTDNVRAADWDSVSQEQRGVINAAVRDVERSLTRPAGDREGAFRRNLVFGVDPRSGYGGWTLPGVTGAIVSPDEARLRSELTLLEERLGVATACLRRAAEVLTPTGA